MAAHISDSPSAGDSTESRTALPKSVRGWHYETSALPAVNAAHAVRGTDHPSFGGPWTIEIQIFPTKP
jgi:hypothetical protein